MKELSIKEKAERYDELLKKLRKAKEDNNVCDERYCCVIDDIVPELRESEDERIRKALIKGFNECLISSSHYPENAVKYWHGIVIDDILAWLEKQGEMDIESYKAAEDEKREFVGDGFIKCYADFQDFKEGGTYWLEYVGNDNYNVRSDNLLGKTYHITPCQLYTIFKKMTWLEKQGTPAKLSEEEQNRFAKGVLTSCAMSFIDYLDAHKYEGKMCVSNGECEDIENAFHNAMWDRLHRYYCKYIEKQGEKKPIDTKDLETAISNILKCYSHIILHRSLTQDELNETDVYAVENTKKLLCFLEQKSADKVEPKFKVGDVIRQTDKPEYTYTIREIKDGCYICDTCDFSTDNPLLELVKKQEWSKDDEQYLLICKNALSKYQVSDKWDAGIISRWLEERLKSIRPQNTWKPSEEHIHGLIWVINRMPDLKKANEAEAVLRDLLEQLNKLRKG